MNRRSVAPSLFRPVATILGGVSILLAGGATAQSIPHPPPICDITLEPLDGQCLSGSHPDYYWPRVCPEQNLSGTGYRLYCRPPAAPPIPVIFCSTTAIDSYVCEGEPRALDGTLTYTWSAPALTISELTEGDASVVVVECAPGIRSRSRYLTLTVSSSNGTSATITGPLACSQ